MKIGRFIYISAEGVEYKLEQSQLEGLLDYLKRQESNDRIAAEAALQSSNIDFLDPEDFDRAAQAAHYAQRRRPLTKVA